MDAKQVTIRRLQTSDVMLYRDLMLEAYRNHPEAFTSDVEERAALPIAWWSSRLREEELASEIVIGAFDGDQLIGAAGVSFETRTKLKHKSHLFGMYIKPYARQHGIGKKLVAAVIQEARSRPNIEIMQLTVSNENTAARTLYENFGFIQFGLEPLAVCTNPGIYISKIYMWLKIRNPD